MSYKLQLKEIVDIITGMSFSAHNADPQGTIHVIQALFIDSNSVLSDFSTMKKLTQLPVRSPAIVRNNDIVMMSRTTPSRPFKASLVKTNNPLVASSSVYIVRLNNNNILPEYLLYVLNSNMFQKYVLEKARGSTITHIAKQALGEIQVPIPSKEKQKIVVDFYHNIQQQDKIAQQKQKLKHELVNATFTHLYSQ